TISSVSREVFRAIPENQREAALALGATRWEMMKLALLRSSRSGLFAAFMLGLGRALGETMAVTMVIGNRAQIVSSLLAPAQTMASVIANEYAEATSDVHLSALALVGLLLFGITFVTNAVARLFIWRLK
ncbi:ABC transporter permease subunit, partial [bacterium]|nr:ABC transporter permease subunit [bacterium]